MLSQYNNIEFLYQDGHHSPQWWNDVKGRKSRKVDGAASGASDLLHQVRSFITYFGQKYSEVLSCLPDSSMRGTAGTILQSGKNRVRSREPPKFC
jgi:hypothetical protein